MAKTPADKRSFGWVGVVGIGLSLVLLVWALRGLHLDEFVNQLRSIHLGWFAATLIAATARFLLVTQRWRYILRLDGAVIPFTPLWHATAIGFMANNIAVARAGEVARAYVASAKTGVKFTAAVASIVVERIMDTGTIVILLALAAAAGGFSADATIGPFTIGEIIAGLSVIFAIGLPIAFIASLKQDLALKIGGKVLHALLPKRWADKILGIAPGFFEGLDALRSPRRFFAIGAWSFAAWGVNGLSFLFCMYAFGIDAPWTAAFVLQSIIAFSVALPQAPGFIGVFEAATKATLIAYGIGGDVAVSYAVAYHVGTFFPITILGFYSLSRVKLRMGDITRGSFGKQPEATEDA